jgi:cyclopropane fatty-acyl-phospholipid synthase-like methyltransferase
MTDIKSMKLYTHVERVYNELAELGKSADAPLDVDELCAFDQLHYHGTGALDHALQALGAEPDGEENGSWLEIGSGLGGPARYLAAHGGVRITALELQADQHELAARLTAGCGLDNRVEHLCGDFLAAEWGARKFDAIVSWLALYHIPERQRLLKKCHALLPPGGYFYTEDLCAIGEIDAAQRAELERDLFAITLPDIATYRRDLQRSGFDILICDDMSADWAAFTRARLAAFRAERERHLRVHGSAVVDALDDFYAAVDRQFGSGKLGGVRLGAIRRK